MGDAGLRADELVQQVRERANRLPWSASVHEPFEHALHPRRLQDHPGLDYAHGHWALPDSYVGDGTGLRSRIRGRVGRLVFSVLHHYLHEERELIAHLLRLNDSLAKRCDELAFAHDNLLDQLDRRASETAIAQEQLASELGRLTGRDGGRDRS